MKVVVDTSVWSLALRRKQENVTDKEEAIVKEFIELISDSRIVIIGPIRQEILSGIKNKKQFNCLKSKLKAFPDFPLTTNDFEKAAEFYNFCRSNGVQGSHIDFLICAVSINNDFAIFTMDNDFDNFSQYLKLNIHSIRDFLPET